MKSRAPIQAVLQTDRGLVRDHNEDFVTRYEPADEGEAATHGWLYIVADGVGGADAGEVASEFASQQTLTHFLESVEENLGQRLVQAMQAANTDLRQMVAERNENKRMATTMVAAIIQDQIAYIANVGDSRAYHWRENGLRQITKDQSLVAKLVEEGAITEAEAVHHPHRNVILYSIGSERSPKIDLFELTLAEGDRLLLCSDGLTRHVRDAEINHIISENNLEAASDTLIQLANERGGQDNISVALIAYGDTETAVAQTEAATVAAEQEVAAVPAAIKDTTTAEERRFLLPYTIFLAVVEAVLIILVWMWLLV